MAKLSEIQAITRRYYLPVLVDQVYEKSPLLRRIFKVAEEGKFGMGVLSATGRDIVEPLEYQETGDVSGSHGAYDCDDTWSGDTTENITGAVNL